jgi:hypothetical protein
MLCSKFSEQSVCHFLCGDLSTITTLLLLITSLIFMDIIVVVSFVLSVL